MIFVADNLQIMNPAIRDAVKNHDPEPIRNMARCCIEAGAQAIDINPGPLSKNPEEKMTFLINTVTAFTSMPLFLDTTNPVALEAGLRACRRRAVINGFSLEPAKVAAILPLARRFDADIIGYLLAPNGQVPASAEGKMAIATELFGICEQTGLDPARLIIDPVIVPLTWEDGLERNRATLSALKRLPDLLGFKVRTIVGLSNLTSGRGPREGKRFLERTFLPMLAAAGLDMVLLNVFHAETMRVARTCARLMESVVFAWEEVQ